MELLLKQGGKQKLISQKHDFHYRFSTVFWGREKTQPWVLEVDFFLFSYVLGKPATSHSRGRWNSLRGGWSKPKSLIRSRTPAWILWSFKSSGHPLRWVFSLPNYKVLDLTNVLHENTARRKHSEQTKSFYWCTVIFQQREDIEHFQREFHYRLIRRPSVLTAFFLLYFLLCVGSFPSNNCNFFWHFLSFFTIRLFSSSVKRQRVSYGLI